MTKETNNKKLSKAQLKGLWNVYQDMEKLMGGFNSGLSYADRQRMIHLNRENYLFITDVGRMLVKKPNLCPGYVDRQSLIDDALFYRQLNELIDLHNHALENLRDIQIVLGDNVFKRGLSVYRGVKDAATSGVPGAKVYYQSLSRRFRKQGFFRDEDEASNNGGNNSGNSDDGNSGMDDGLPALPENSGSENNSGSANGNESSSPNNASTSGDSGSAKAA